MKKLIYLSVLAIAITSCKQEAAMPTEAEITQKVTDKYGAELNTLKELKAMQCNETINQQVSERLTAAAKATK